MFSHIVQVRANARDFPPMSNETDLLAVKSDGEYTMDELSATHRRTARAVTETMVVVPVATELGVATNFYRVYSASQSHLYCD